MARDHLIFCSYTIIIIYNAYRIRVIYLYYIFKYNKLYDTHTHNYKLNETSQRLERYDRSENDSRGNEVFCI